LDPPGAFRIRLPELSRTLERSSGKLGYLEDEFSADMASLDHLMRANSIFERKHFDRGDMDQATIYQVLDLPH
jgi:hypothetical protein